MFAFYGFRDIPHPVCCLLISSYLKVKGENGEERRGALTRGGRI